MTDYQYFNVPSGTKIRILQDNGTWREAELVGPPAPAKAVLDYRRAWIDLAEELRKFCSPEEDFRALMRIMVLLPISSDLKTALMETVGDVLPATAHFPESARDGWAHKVAMILEGQPDFDVPRFLHHATSDDPNGKWSYQVANPEGEWSRDPSDPSSCAKIDVESV